MSTTLARRTFNLARTAAARQRVTTDTRVASPLLNQARTFSATSRTSEDAKESSATSPFAFLPSNKLELKQGRGERGKGLTEIRGSYYNPVTYTYLDELLSDWGGKYICLIHLTAT